MDVKNAQKEIETLCDLYIGFWSAFKDTLSEADITTKSDLCLMWHNYFEKNTKALGQLSKTKWMMQKLEQEATIENIDALSAEEFDKVLYDCGIESIKPSVESEYVECLSETHNTDESKGFYYGF